MCLWQRRHCAWSLCGRGGERMLLWYFEFPCAWLVITQSVGRVRTWVLKEMEALSSFTFFTAMELP